nr:uncharacterized protein LOC111512983 [Leptinotarsa decemlineata]
MEGYSIFNEQNLILNNTNTLFDDKIEALVKVWKTIAEIDLVKCDLKRVIHVVDWAILHTLNSVLIAEWNYYKLNHGDGIQNVIKDAQRKVVEFNSNFNSRFERLIYVVKVPWTHSILMNLMKTKDARISSEEIEFFHFEQTYLISLRLKILCESRCQDFALNLVTAFMTCYSSLENASVYLNASIDQFWYMFDVHVALLYQVRHRKAVRELLGQLNLEEGLSLVKRFYNKKIHMMKLWKNCRKIAISATQLFLTRAVNENDETLTRYLETYIGMCSTENLLRDLCVNIEYISFILNPAVIYACCEVLQRKLDSQLKAFIVEMYIKGLTADMNELEHQKLIGDNEKVVLITSRLANALCKLAQVFDENVEVAKECILTAFSLEPTEERLLSIESMAEKSGFQICHSKQDWKCPLHPPVLPTDELTWKCATCNDWRCKPQLEVPLKMNITLNEAVHNSILGIPGALCDDLIVCISNPRYQILKWCLPWDVLHRLCIMYLKDPEATKNLVTDLKYLDIDYSIFQGIKKEPLDEYAGIEKGYERYLDTNFLPVEHLEPQRVVPDKISDNFVDGRDYDCLNNYLHHQKTSVKCKNASSKLLPIPEPRSILKKNVLYSGASSVILRNIAEGKIQKKKNYQRKSVVVETTKRSPEQPAPTDTEKIKMRILRNSQSIVLDKTKVEECFKKK